MIGPDAAQATLSIDLDALKANWRLLADRVAPAACGAVVKADAYGLGIEQAVPALARGGCRIFFVAHLTEGVRARAAVREAGFDDAIDIYLLHGLQPGLHIHPDYAAYRLLPVLGSRPELEAWSLAGAGPCALQIDTGMNRIGLAAEALAGLSPGLLDRSGAVLLMSHFVSAEEPWSPLNTGQIERFEAVQAVAFPGLPASLANSSGIFLPQQPFYDLVRPGYALYGGNPCPGQPNPMRPVIRLDAGILQTREIGAGESVGYNSRWTASRPTRLATIGVGYADGVPRGARSVGTGDGPVALVGGVRCPWVGRVSMDLSIIDVTDAPPDATGPGALVELIGSTNTVDDFGAQCGTIGYEILTGLGGRYSRVYVENT
jgi:alanine racemase